MSNSKLLSNVASNLANSSGKILTVANGKIVWSQNYAFDTANNASSNTIIIQGINDTQNTNISSAFVQANTGVDQAQAAFSKANSSITLGSTPVYLGSTNTSISGLTLTNPVIDGFTGNTGIINIGSGQIYKDVSGNIGIGTNSPGSASGYTTLDVSNTTNGSRIRCLVGSTAYGGMYTNGTTDFRIGSLAAVPLLIITGSNSIARFDTSGNFGLGVSPSAWNTNSSALQIGSLISIESSTTGFTNFGSNFYRDSAGGFKFIQNGYASASSQYQGTHRWFTSITQGTADANWSPTQVMILDASGNLGIGATSPSAKFHILGTGASGGIFVEDGNVSQDSPVVRVRGNRSDGNGSQSFSGGLVLEKYNSGSQLVSGGVLGTVYFGGNYSGSSFGYPASISAIASSNWSSSTTANTDLIFLTGSTAQTSLGVPNTGYGTERIRIDAIGNIRMGDISSPSDSGRYFDIYNVASGSSSFAILRLITQQVASSSTTSVDFLKNKAGAFVINNNDTNAAVFTAFGVGGTERMRIDSSGNVGIGTSSPLGRLHTSETNGINYFESPGISSIALQFRTNGTNRYRIGTPSASADLQFLAGGTTETMRLDSSGNLLLNCTSNPMVGFGQAKLTVHSGSIDSVNLFGSSSANMLNLQRPFGYTNGTMIAFSSINSGGSTSSQVGSITISGSTTTYATSSDYRLKENVKPIQNALNSVDALNPVTFDWKIDGSKGQGFIAHELQDIVPDCVVGEKDGEQMQCVDYGKLTPILVAAIQELTQRIKQLESK